MERIIHLKSSSLEDGSITQICFSIYLETFEFCEYFVKTQFYCITTWKLLKEVQVVKN